jgi:hypothetical protein
MESEAPAKHDDQEDVIFVLNDETDEPSPLECGDTLPPVTETGDTIDTDNPIQYTREQLLFHVLNTLTYKVKVIDRSHWIRIANEFVDLMLSGDERPFPQSVVPIVKGRRVVVVSDGDTAEDGEADADADTVVRRATMATLLQQRIPQGAPPFKDNLKRLYHVERIFVDGIDSLGAPTATFKVPQKMRAHLYSSDRKVTLFPPTNLYEGDTVEVVGFVFGEGDDPVQFDPEQYKRNLVAMSAGDRVLVWPHHSAKPLRGTVLEHDSETLKVETGGGEFVLRVDDIWKNRAFVYPEGSEDLLSRKNALSRGVVTKLLQGDVDGSLTLQTIVPRLEDVLRFSKETMVSLDDAKHVGLEAQIGALFEEDMDVDTLDTLSGILSASVNTFQFPTSPFFGSRSVAGPVTVTLPDLSAFNYKPYASEGTFADSDLNRLKHIFGQGDDGMVYMLHNVGQSVDRILHGIRKHSSKIFSGGAGACEGDPHEKIAQRTFASWAEMEAYSNAPLGEVVELGPNGTLYIRFRASNGDHVWVRHVSQPKQAVCSGTVDFKSIAQMARLPCAYDNYDQVCASAEALRQQNEIRNNDIRASMHSKARALHEKRGEHKAAITKWMAKVAAHTGEAKVYGVQLAMQEDTVDYSTFSGDPEQMDFEGMYNNRESTVFYAPLRPVDNVPGNDAENEGDPYVTGLTRALGLKLPSESIALIAKNLQSRFSGEETLPTKLEALRQAVHRKAMTELTRQLKSEETPSKATREALVAKAKAWEEQTFAKKKKELEEKITGKGQKVLYACALIAIMSQIAGPDLKIEFIHPKCAKTFSTGMVSYVACAARVLADSDVFGGVEMSLKNLEAEVESILKNNAQMANAYLASRNVGERRAVEITLWAQFRPVLGAADEHIKAVRNKRAGVHKKTTLVRPKPVLNLAATKSKTSRVDVKPIAFKQVIRLKRLYGADAAVAVSPKEIAGLPSDLAEAVGNNSAAFWDRFTDRTYNLFDILSSKLPLDAQAVSAVSQAAFHPTQDNALHTRNVMRAFLDNELKSLLGKVANRWKSSSSASEEDTVSLILQIEAIPGLADELSGILRQTSQGVLASVGLLEAGDTVRSLYMLDYILVYTLYSIAAIVNKNKMDTMTIVEVVRTPKARFDAVMAVCNLVLRRCAAALKRNTFVTAEILHTHEVLREERKEKIIQGAERLHGEEKKTFLEATKLGLFTWEDLPQEDTTQAEGQGEGEIERDAYWVMDEDDDEDYTEGGNGEFD